MPNILIRLSKCNDIPVCYFDQVIKNKLIELNGFFLITSDLIKDDIERRIGEQHFSPLEARLWIAAHETRHRVQHLLEVRYQNKSMLKRNPFMKHIDKSVRAPLESLFGRKNFLKGLKKHYPGSSKNELRERWREERDAEFIALLAVSIYRGCQDLKLVAKAILFGAKKHV